MSCRRSLSIALALALPLSALAGGTDNPVLSAASLGYAGTGVALADGPDTVFYNPAGLTRLRGRQLSQGLSIVSGNMKVTDEGSTRAQDPFARPCHAADDTACPVVVDPAGPGHILPRFQPIPDLYLAAPVNDWLTLGLGVYTPMGAKVSYRSDWFGQGMVQRGELQTVNINPSLGLRLASSHSLGLGLDIEVARVYQRSAVDVGQGAKYYGEAVLQDAGEAGLLGLPVGRLLPLGELYQQLLPGPVKSFLGDLLVSTGGISGDAGISYEGFGVGVGWNAGYLFELSERTRFGLAFRSQIRIPTRGDVDWDFTRVQGQVPDSRNLPATMPAGQYLSTYYRPDTTGHVDVIDPLRVSAGFFHQLTPRLMLLADVAWAQQSATRELRMRFADQTGPDGEVIRQGDAVIPQYWRDTVRVSAGLGYVVNARWLLRGGIAYDQSPITDPRYRHPGGPDSDRLMLALGARFLRADGTRLDLGYGFIRLDDASSRYHESCTMNYYERPDNSAGAKDECTANGGNFRAQYSDGRVHVLSFSLTKML